MQYTATNNALQRNNVFDLEEKDSRWLYNLEYRT